MDICGIDLWICGRGCNSNPRTCQCAIHTGRGVIKTQRGDTLIYDGKGRVTQQQQPTQRRERDDE